MYSQKYYILPLSVCTQTPQISTNKFKKKNVRPKSLGILSLAFNVVPLILVIVTCMIRILGTVVLRHHKDNKSSSNNKTHTH